ncbi:probable methyltransferase PMT27 [Gastrolobium bilobum]|uniref:probable methyltransferase PMT27 n=1 Tax=Gastrolobium bilobum TaxID=150636 RepID=UPI002AB2F5FC|nr:probable methyltransferase PMT27 [Gastrolobium bilobum]
MALQTKSRNNRRSSSSTSYASTLTTLVFVALCVLGIWMLTSNSVVSPKTRAAIDNSETINDLSSTEDPVDTTTTTTTRSNSDDSTETTTTATTTSNSDDSLETTTTTISEEPPETTTTTKSQDQKDTTVYGDNPGNLPDDAIKSGDVNTITNTNNDPQKQEATSQISEESSLTQKQEASITNEAGSDNDQKMAEPEKDETQVSEGNQKDENTESQNANAGENQEQNTGGQDVQSFDTQGLSKNNEDEANEQQLREDKGEITEKKKPNEEQKENHNLQDESQERHKPKPEKNRRKSSKKESKKSWSTQADESQGEKERQKDETESSGAEETQDLKWNLCNVTAGADFIPCLDNEKYLKHSPRKHYEHRERHCPEDAPTCLVALPNGYKTRVQWPNSRDKIWYHNVPHTKLAEVKGHQNWVKMTGEFLTFPGGGTQFIHGALHYIDFLQQAEAGIAWGKHTRVILDVGCGVGSFGGYLFERDVIAVSFAPKDEHEAQVQFALERGIPAISAVMGTQRLQFPGRVFDLVHCARCRVPWHEEGGKLLLELNRVLRPGGYFVWSATPVYQTLEEDVAIWKQMSSLTKAMCWDLVTIKKDALNQVGAAFYRKPTSNECYEQREQNQPPICKDDDDPNAAWYIPLQACMHRLPVDKTVRGTKWPEAWPSRLQKAPYWLNNSQDFAADNEHWKNVVDELSNIGVTWSNVRNIMDMRAVYGGFAAALKDLPVWVFNVVNVDSADTLPIIYERGLIGIYHDWCESFSTYPRTYDLLHADNLFSNLKNRCKLVPVIAEVDRILRPEGMLIVRDEPSAIGEVENLLKSMHWEITSKNQEGLLCAKKATWRPDSYVTLY